MSDPKKLKQNIDKARNEVLEKVAEWYVLNNENVLPIEILRVPRPYKGRIEYYFEPPLPGHVNPVVVEEYIGDSWTIRTEPRLK